MRILSIDIGIKNLAFCLINDTIVEQWSVIDLSASLVEPVDADHKCSCVTKTKGPCTKTAFYTKEGRHFCKTHANGHLLYLVCPPELLLKSLKKCKIGELKDLCTKYKIPTNFSLKKEQLLNILNQHRENNCFQELAKAPKVNASKIDLVTIGKAIKTKFDEVFVTAGKIDTVLIENQISPIANRMKTIQGMVAQYFILKEICDNIQFVSAGHKLNQFLKGDVNNALVEDDDEENVVVSESTESIEGAATVNTATYKDRKQSGIAKCIEELGKATENKKWIPVLQTHKKKDDLADCFLQGFWYINKSNLKK